MSKTRTADIVVIGGGVYGCSIAYSLMKHGTADVVLLERYSIGSGGTAKSCAIVRTHYSVLANMEHAIASLKIFAAFDEIVGGDAGFQRTGYLILGPPEHKGPMEEVFRAQNERGVDTETLTQDEARRVHPLLRLDDVAVIGYDTMTGFCDPELTTTSYAKRAGELGASILADTPVTGVQIRGEMKTVQTPSGSVEAPVLVIAAGPWTQTIGDMIGVQFPYASSRHKVITLKAGELYDPSWPVIKDLTVPEKFYMRPAAGGAALVGTGDYGDPIDDADVIADEVESGDVSRMTAMVARRVPAFSDGEYAGGWTAPYDIAPDWNPVVGPVPGFEGVHVAVGFSGHGFKLAPTIGESLAQTVLGLEPLVPIDMYSMDRFDRGMELQGAYGTGSIS